MALALVPPPSQYRPAFTPAVAAVEPGSVAAGLGIAPGDLLLSVNGHRLRDIIDYRFYTAEERLELEVERNGRRRLLPVERAADEPLGVEFESVLFDEILRCNNNCYFCFIAGNRKEMRRSLFIKDDDYRLSFLFGDFITLTNLTPDDWDRIEEQRLSPLYVSIHATDLELRRRLLANKHAGDVLLELDRLASCGIQTHCQIVLCPGINDGEHLEESVTGLAARYPWVQSISVVPVGLTELNQVRGARKLKAGAPLTDQVCTPDEAQAVLAQVRPYQREYLRRYDTPLVYLADEFYLLAGKPVPPARYYGDYPQFENGIGMVRWLVQDWARTKRRLERLRIEERRLPLRRMTLACGTLIAPVLQPLLGELAGLIGAELELVPVQNQTYGTSITCSGLLTAGDILAALQEHALGDAVVLPRRALDAPGKVFLDDVTPAEMQALLGRPILYVETLSELVDALQAEHAR